jgi:hypothetical protein
MLFYRLPMPKATLSISYGASDRKGQNVKNKIQIKALSHL